MYPSDLSDEEWALVAHHFERKDPRGQKPTHSKRIIVNAILYISKTGAQWRMLPMNFPPWKTVYDHYWRWNQRNIWENVLDEINELHRKKAAKSQPPVLES
ncbi:transposase [Nitrosomonas sp. Is37]|uniref:transposase n=1 Tax=Nitrosomonas sp. Is37 TaxID=3080535 RepID=UPI00294B5F4A|nr:transposase [Nitrosomonas sp. Is37]MDV6344147.1 transposase [Nitrosomonas sp. Is37]